MSKIMVVDDSKMIRVLLTQSIVGLGYEALEASNGQEALEVLAAEANNIKLILLDWNMPVMNGYEFLQKFRENGTYKGIQIMMVTTEGERVHVIKALRFGVVNYLTKPFSPEDITTKIHECLGAAESGELLNNLRELPVPKIEDI